MFGKSEKIFNVYEKPESSDPADRVVLVREGFSIWALLLNAFWLIGQRMWAVLAIYIVLMVAVMHVAQTLQVSEPASVLLQFFLQLLLAFHAYDLKGWTLKRRGYRLAGILTGLSETHATRRYYEYAA